MFERYEYLLYICDRCGLLMVSLVKPENVDRVPFDDFAPHMLWPGNECGTFRRYQGPQRDWSFVPVVASVALECDRCGERAKLTLTLVEGGEHEGCLGGSGVWRLLF